MSWIEPLGMWALLQVTYRQSVRVTFLSRSIVWVLRSQAGSDRAVAFFRKLLHVLYTCTVRDYVFCTCLGISFSVVAFGIYLRLFDKNVFQLFSTTSGTSTCSALLVPSCRPADRRVSWKTCRLADRIYIILTR